jgi:hypothetical protein
MASWALRSHNPFVASIGRKNPFMPAASPFSSRLSNLTWARSTWRDEFPLMTTLGETCYSPVTQAGRVPLDLFVHGMTDEYMMPNQDFDDFDWDSDPSPM